MIELYVHYVRGCWGINMAVLGRMKAVKFHSAAFEYSEVAGRGDECAVAAIGGDHAGCYLNGTFSPLSHCVFYTRYNAKRRG